MTDPTRDRDMPDTTIGRDVIGRERDTLTGSPGADEDFQRASTDRELPIPDYDELSVRGAKVRLDDLNPEQLRALRAYESENKKRKTIIHEIDRRLR